MIVLLETQQIHLHVPLHLCSTRQTRGESFNQIHFNYQLKQQNNSLLCLILSQSLLSIISALFFFASQAIAFLLHLEITPQGLIIISIVVLQFLLMYRREREFNIISGESLPFSTQTYRSASNFEKVRKFENNPHLPVAKLEKLGHSKDRREYQYSYESIPQAAKRETGINQRGSTNFEQTMLNSVSTDYNIVNLKAQHPTSKVVSSQIFNQKLPEVNKKSPLTAHIHAGRLFASHYHEDYPERSANREFFRRKNLCDQVCEDQKTYGMTYFRHLK